MIEHVIELIPAYALDCLDKEEAAQVSAHLAGCSVCQEELHAYREVVGELAISVRQVETPASLKTGLMERIGARPAVQASPERRTESRPSAWQRFLAGLRMTPGLAAASLALVLVLFASNVFLWSQVNDLRANQQRTPFQVVAMTGTAANPQGTGMIVVSLDGEHGTLIVDHLPALDSKHQYQLWLIKDGKRDSGAVFSVSSEGYGSVWVESPKPLDSYQTFGVTIEPVGGSPGPTGEKVLGGGF